MRAVPKVRIFLGIGIFLSLGAVPALGVIPIDAGGLIAPANYFDLQGKTLRFTPASGGYRLKVSKAKAFGSLGTQLGKPEFASNRSPGWRVELPFEFPYAGRTWRELFVNDAGNLTFGRPEAQLYPERDTWPAGTMLSVGASLASRAAAGQEQMICAFWGLNSAATSRIFVRSGAKEMAVTWQVERMIRVGEGYQPLGPNIFSATLRPGGVIELSYQRVSEKDGIVGLFTGGMEGRVIGTLEGSSAPAPDPRLKIRSAEVALTGKTVRFTIVMDRPVVESVPEGMLWYRVFLSRGPRNCEIGYEVSRNARPYTGRECVGTAGVRVEGNRLELFASAYDLAAVAGDGLRWKADVLWERAPGATFEQGAAERPLSLPDAALQPSDLSAARVPRAGSIYEVFHYPHVGKSVFPHLRYIYERYEPRDDMAVVLYDFRIDDLHNHQGSTGAGYNVAIQGIGDRPAHVTSGAELMGSTKLQVATGPIYLGPRFDEFLVDGDRRYHNYANAIGWMAHELTHRWGMALKFRNPYTADLETLHNQGHWSDFLNTPSMYSVWKMFCDQPYSEKSQMEGFVYDELPDGKFRRQPRPWNMPTGFSALDLYAMGLIAPGEAPGTFLIWNPKPVGNNIFRGVKVPVRIQDVIAASGPRVPDFGDSQKEFALGMYLLHEGGRTPYADKLRQAEGIEKKLVEYFRVATGGRMRVIPVEAKPRAKPISDIVR